MKADQHIVHGVLKACGWLMQFAGSLGGELAQLIAISNVSQRAKYQL